MVRSGLQQDVINMYRQGVRNAFSKPHDARPAFMLHLRYNFRVPKLAKRDYTAIEHQQLRRMSHTLEMLSSSSVRKLNVSGDMIEWWDREIGQRRMASSSASSSTSAHSLPSESDSERNPDPPAKPSGEAETSGEKGQAEGTEGDTAGSGAEQEIGGGKMPGPGGT